MKKPFTVYRFFLQRDDLGVLTEPVASDHDERHYVGMADDIPTVTIKLWRSDAVVLFDWLMSTDLDSVPITHPAQKQALMDLLTRLEHETEIPGVTQEQIDMAQAEVARDMAW
ncbi:hypothetical protein [Amycolatopsis sp. NPDC057786]|uniref:hypothetical protein n=1 Tax=Amycolatopsis sp. NPDC057786 TaxID=3346250 RepID=UPI00366F889C